MSHSQVLEFHTAFKVAIRDTPKIDVPEKDFRYKLIAEEIDELAEALDNDDLVEVADAFGDIIVVTYGAALTFGVEIESLVEMARTLAKDMDLYSKATNAFFSHDGRETVLRLLSESLETNNPRLVQATLTTIIVSVEYAAIIMEIPLKEIVDVVHKSNMSKLGADGQPVYIEYGDGDIKIGKGPNYKKPTEDIKRILGLSGAEA